MISHADIHRGVKYTVFILNASLQLDLDVKQILHCLEMSNTLHPSPTGAVLGGFTGFQKPVRFTELAYYTKYTLIKQSRFMDNVLIKQS